MVDAPTKVADSLDSFNKDLGADDPDRIRVIYVTSGRAAFDELQKGNVDFALAATSPVANYVFDRHASGAGQSDIVVIASVGLSNQSYYLITSRQNGIEDPLDIPGKRLGLIRGSSAEFAWTNFAAAYGLPEDSVELVDTPIVDQGEALADGSIDIAMTWEPYGSYIARDLGDDAVTFTTRDVHSVNWLLLTSRKTADEHPEQVDRVLRAYRDAIDYIHQNPEDARRIHSNKVNLAVEDLARLEETIFWRLDLTWSVLANMENHFIRNRKQRGLTRIAPSPTGYIHADGLRRVAPERVAIPDHLIDKRRATPSRPADPTVDTLP